VPARFTAAARFTKRTGRCSASALGTPLDIQLEDLDRFAKEVIPAFRVTKMAAAAK
jgi:hypothetical protein